MPTIKLPDFRSDEWDHLVVEIDKPGAPPGYVFKKLLSIAAMLSFAREGRFARQAIRIDRPKGISEGNSTIVGLQIAAELAEKFSQLDEDPKTWQNQVHLYESYNIKQLQEAVQDLNSDIQMLEHTEALQEVNRALAYLQRYYPVQRTRAREGELSGGPNPDVKVPVIPLDSRGQCPAGWMFNAILKACVEMPENQKADTALRRNRTQHFPEGVTVVMGTEAGPDNSGEPNPAMGSTRKLNGLQEGELSGGLNPDAKIQTVQPDARGQCPPGWMYDGGRGACVKVPLDVAASSDLRKPRGMTDRTQFTPEGVDTVLGSSPGRDNSGEPNRAMGNVQGLGRMQEGELSGGPNPDQVLQGVDPDSKGQCPRGTIFSALVGKCIQLSVDQQADALRGNRTQHFPEGTDVVMGSQAGPDNSGEPNPAMGFHGPLATLEGESRSSLSNRYAYCMGMLKPAGYSYYAGMHASERFCFFMFEGVNDGFINTYDKMVHAHPFNLTAKTEEFLDSWRKTEEADFNKKTEMDNAYQRDIEHRLRYRKTLVQFIQHGRTDEQIRRALEQTQLSREAVRSLMVDVSMLRRVTPSKPHPRIIIQMGTESAASSKPLSRKEQVDQVEDAARKRVSGE